MMLCPPFLHHGRPLIDISNFGGFTPLMYASWFDHGEMVAALVQRGASLKRRALGWGYNADPYCMWVQGSWLTGAHTGVGVGRA